MLTPVGTHLNVKFEVGTSSATAFNTLLLHTVDKVLLESDLVSYASSLGFSTSLPITAASTVYPASLPCYVTETRVYDNDSSVFLIKRNVRTIGGPIHVTARLSDTPIAEYALPLTWVRKWQSSLNPAVPILTTDATGGRGFIMHNGNNVISIQGIAEMGSFDIYNFELEDFYTQ